MARDSKLVFNFTNANSGNAGTLNVWNPTLTGTTATAYFAAPSGGATYGFQRAASNALNKSGFRDQQADQSQIATINSVVSAIANDPAVVGNTEMYEAYVRVTYGQLGAALASGQQLQILIEAASDSGTGTAGTDWSPVSSAVIVSTAPRTYGSQGSYAMASGVVTLASHGLVLGDVVMFTGASMTNYTAGQPLYVVAVVDANTFRVSTTPNGAVASTYSGTSMTVYATPVTGKRIVSIPCAPTAKPWLRVAVYSLSTGTASVQYSGVFIQDAFVTIGRDSAALA